MMVRPMMKTTSEEVTEDIDLSSIDIQGKLVILKEDITVTVTPLSPQE